MPNTTNFNWPTPADTDLVKDGAAAIRNLGNGVDTSLVDLKGGTTGQILSKASNADMDFTFITPNVGDITEVQAGTGISIASGTGPIPVITNTVATAFDAAGDLVYGTGADTFTKLSIGTAGKVLAVNSGATAPEWVTPAAGGGLTLLDTLTLTGSTVTSSSLSGSYKNLLCVYKNVYSSTSDTSYIRLNTDTSSNYAFATVIGTSSATASNDAGTSYIRWISTGNNSAAKQKATGVLRVYRYTDTDQVAVQGAGYVYPGSNVATTDIVNGVYDNSAAITTISFIVGGSTWSGGTVYIYGES